VATGLNSDPYWWEAAPPRRMPVLPVAKTCDVAIVGAGYAGLAAALVLARAGRSVQVFDTQRPGEGASTRNGGLASGNLRQGFGEMIQRRGLTAAKRFYNEGKVAREALAHFLHREEIECDYQPVGRFVGAVQPSHYESQAREAERLNTHLGLDAQMIPRAEQHTVVGSDLYHGGMLRPELAGLHPARFHAGLLEKVCAEGVAVHGETAVLGTRREVTGFSVETARGRIQAKQVVMATNGYTDTSNRWLQRRLVPVPSRMIATEPLAGETMARLIPKGTLLGETRQLYHYFRPSPDGTRILFGGRERTWGGGQGDPAMHLRDDLAAIFPELSAVGISHSWFGYVAFNLDFLPRMFARDGIHYVTGFCGSGVVWAWWLGSCLGQKLAGKTSDESAFACAPPRAIPFYSGTPWFLPASLAWFGLKDRLGVGAKK